MTAPTSDYREYHKNLGGRPYRISRIFFTNFTSMARSPLTIVVMAFSYFFLFFSIMGIALSSPVEDLQDDYLESLKVDTYFEVLPETNGDLQRVVRLDSNFTVNYTVKNIGSEPSTPLMLFLVPNSFWDYEADLPLEELEPGEQVTVRVKVRVPESKYIYGQLPDDGYRPEQGYVDIYIDDDEKTPDIADLPVEMEDLRSISDFHFFGQSVIYENLISRFVMLIVVPSEMIDLSGEFGIENALSHPAISSIATLVSLARDEPGLYVDREGGMPDLGKKPSFRISVKDSNPEPYEISLRASQTKELLVKVLNTGEETLIIDLESLLMPVYDWYWDIEVTPLVDRDLNPNKEIVPGGEMEYLVRISAGYYSGVMPYNLVLLATDTYSQDHSLSETFHVIVNIKGGPEDPGMGEEFHEILWGGGIRYERFMWIIMLTAVAGSGLISNDLRNNSLTLYLSRPISWKEYVIGKFLSLSLLLSLITIVPAVLLFLAEVAFRDVSPGYVLGNIPVFGGMLLAYLVTISVFSSIALALSSSTNRWIFAGVGIFAYFIFTPPVGDLLADLFENEHFRLLNINYVLKIAFKPLFGLDFNADSTGFGYHLPVLVILVVLLGSWAIVYNRFKGKEVAK